MPFGAGGEFPGGGPSAPSSGGGTPAPGSGSGGIQTLTGPQLATGLILDSTSDRFITLEGVGTGNGATIGLKIGPDSGHLTTISGQGGFSPEPCVAQFYVPKGWFIESVFFDCTFVNAWWY